MDGVIVEVTVKVLEVRGVDDIQGATLQSKLKTTRNACV